MSKKITKLPIVNFYDHIEKVDQAMYKYPNESALNIKLPFRMLLCGPSGTGKTNLLLNIIKYIGIFDKIILLAKDLEEPLYKHLIKAYASVEKKCKTGPMLLAISNIKDMPAVADCNVKENTLFICDDLICEDKKDLKKVEAFWMNARKVSVSMVFLSQGYFCIPKFIRMNSNYILIKKLHTPKDMKALIREYAVGVTPAQMVEMYDYAMSGDPHTSFFMIDTETSNDRLKFRSQFYPFE